MDFDEVRRQQCGQLGIDRRHGGRCHGAQAVEARANLSPFLENPTDGSRELIGNVCEIAALRLDDRFEVVARPWDRRVVWEETFASRAPRNGLWQRLRRATVRAQQNELPIPADFLRNEFHLLRQREKRKTSQAATGDRLRFEFTARLEEGNTSPAHPNCRINAETQPIPLDVDAFRKLAEVPFAMFDGRGFFLRRRDACAAWAAPPVRRCRRTAIRSRPSSITSSFASSTRTFIRR